MSFARIAYYTVAAVLGFIGIVWVLQGANLLQGSFMTGRVEWLVAGLGSIIMGAGFALYARRRSMKTSSSDE